MSFVLYRSSAGSGKTYTLVMEYLKIILQNPEKFKHILAVTFTNKAANEMKERIMISLKRLAKGEDKDLEANLKQALPNISRIDLTASKILTALLHNYSDFAIMTIDSFIHKVIKAFALEIGLPLNFGIDLNYEKIETYVSEQLLASVGKDPFVTEIIMEFVFARVREEKSWNIEGDIRKFEKELFSEKNLDWVNAMGDFDPGAFRMFKERLERIREDYVLRFNQLGLQALDLMRSANLTVDDFAYKKSGAAGFLYKCAFMRKGDEKDLEPTTRFLNGTWYAKSAATEIKNAIDGLLENGLEDIAHKITTHFHQNRPAALTASAILGNIHLAAIINHLKKLIDQYKTKYNVIPSSEFNVKVYDIVANSPVPFIYSILGEKFSHYLIDEFQDTSTLQWANLYPLIDNALGSNFFNMAVGDGKQSIYRWRGGDVEIMEKDIENRIHPQQLKIKPLAYNYRSRQGIVEFNNRLFEALSAFYKTQNPLLDQIYSGIAQTPKGAPGGLVSLEFIDEPDGDQDVDGMVFAPVYQLIRSHIDSGADPGDIAILVRENKNGQKIAERLLEKGIQVVSPDSLILARIPLIRFLVDILTYLGNPKDKIKAASVIFYLGLNKKENAPEAGHIGAAYMAGQQWELTPEIREFYSRKKYLIRMPVYEVVEEIIRIFKLDQSLTFDTRGYLQAFLDIVSNYTAENSVDTAAFLEWWELNKDQFAVMVPESKPAIKIMSIHKAKGLEFPVVIIPYAAWDHKMDPRLWLRANPVPVPEMPEAALPMPVNSNKILSETFFKDEYNEETEKVLIDNINLLYVAFTRAVDQLHIVCRSKKDNENYQRLHQLAVPLLTPDPQQAGRYAAGAVPETASKKSKTAEIVFETADTFMSAKWYNRISIRRKSSEFWRFDKSYRARQRNWGILVHKVLSEIRCIDDITGAIELMTASGDMSVNERRNLESKLNDIFNIPQVREWFDPSLTVFTESPIITPHGVIKPDRVVMKDNHVIIIDFKTGHRSPTHAQQITTYRDALTAMGYSDTDAYLFYTGTLHIHHVED